MRQAYELRIPYSERNNPDPSFSALLAGLDSTAHGITRLRYRGKKKLFS